MSQEVFHQTMSLNFFSHINFIVKKFLFQFQKSLETGTHSLAMPNYGRAKVPRFMEFILISNIVTLQENL
jgi:hypothetical protein